MTNIIVLRAGNGIMMRARSGIIINLRKMIQVIKTFEGKGWSIRKSERERNIRNFKTRQEAIQFGHTLAMKENGELYVHKKDGMIDFVLKYGN